jgi:hypothetical protein
MCLSFDGLRYAQIIPAFNEHVVPRFWGRPHRFALKDDGSVGQKDVSPENSGEDVDIVIETDWVRIETLSARMCAERFDLAIAAASRLLAW